MTLLRLFQGTHAWFLGALVRSSCRLMQWTFASPTIRPRQRCPGREWYECRQYIQVSIHAYQATRALNILSLNKTIYMKKSRGIMLHDLYVFFRLRSRVPLWGNLLLGLTLGSISLSRW